jgi:hypothetical protein
MARVRVLLDAEADIEQALAFTLRSFGVRKYDDYGSLILEALEALTINPHAGKRRPEIAALAWTYHIPAGPACEALADVSGTAGRHRRGPGAGLRRYGPAALVAQSREWVGTSLLRYLRYPS